MKELLDNALDFGGESPTIHVEITEKGRFQQARTPTIAVEDDGLGISGDQLDRIFGDVDAFGGTKRHYARTDRGNQGNALMTVLGIQHLCDDVLRFETDGREYHVDVSKDPIRGEFDVSVNAIGGSDIKGTRIEVNFGDKAAAYTGPKRVRRTFDEFVALNPHAEFHLTVRKSNDDDPETWVYPPSQNPTGASLTIPGSATTGKPTWFTPDDFAGRLDADVRAKPTLSIEEFVGEFCGLAGRNTRKQVINAFETLFPDIETIEDLYDDSGRRVTPISGLYQAMCKETTPFAEGGLDSTIGSVGRDLTHYGRDDAQQVLNQLNETGEADAFDGPDDIMTYRSGGTVVDDDDGDLLDKTVPFYFEVAAVPSEILQKEEESNTTVAFGINQSVTYSTPIFSPILTVQYTNRERQCSSIVDAFEPLGHDFEVICNLTCPNIDFQDKGKQSFNTEPFTEVIEDVVGKTVRKIERDIRPRLNAAVEDLDPEPDPSLGGKADKGFIKEFVFDHFWEVYNRATNNGQFDLEMRQFYYAMREPLMAEATRRGYEHSWNASFDNPTPFKLTGSRFRTLVTEFEEEDIGHRLIERDDRGFFVEPHTGRRIRLGTAAVNNYEPDLDQYSALLFIEKTGFIGIIEQTEIAKEYDIGVVNAKGYSTLAARTLVENIQASAKEADRGIPMLALTDLDIAGLGIATDAKKTDQLSPVDELDVERIGISMDDVEQYDLPAEPASYSQAVRTQLKNSHEAGTVSDDAYDFLTIDDGQRVEINALTPVEFAEYLETTFDELGIEKVHPDENDVETLETDENQITDVVEDHADGIGRGIHNYLDATQGKLRDAIEEHDDVPNAEDLRTRLEEADLPIGENAVETVHKQIVEELAEFPPKSWKDINDDLLGDHEGEYDEIVGEHKEEVADAVEELLDEHATISVELDFDSASD